MCAAGGMCVSEPLRIPLSPFSELKGFPLHIALLVLLVGVEKG